MALTEVKKAMNMKWAMNKLCGGGDAAKKKKSGCVIKASIQNIKMFACLDPTVKSEH